MNRFFSRKLVSAALLAAAALGAASAAEARTDVSFSIGLPLPVVIAPGYVRRVRCTSGPAMSSRARCTSPRAHTRSNPAGLRRTTGASSASASGGIGEWERRHRGWERDRWHERP